MDYQHSRIILSFYRKEMLTAIQASFVSLLILGCFGNRILLALGILITLPYILAGSFRYLSALWQVRQFEKTLEAMERC
jgi:hypothetical protein